MKKIPHFFLVMLLSLFMGPSMQAIAAPFSDELRGRTVAAAATDKAVLSARAEYVAIAEQLAVLDRIDRPIATDFRVTCDKAEDIFVADGVIEFNEEEEDLLLSACYGYTEALWDVEEIILNQIIAEGDDIDKRIAESEKAKRDLEKKIIEIDQRNRELEKKIAEQKQSIDALNARLAAQGQEVLTE